MCSDNIYFIVNLDISTNSFSIIPITESLYQEKISQPAKAFGTKEDNVQKNEYNNISFKYYEEEDVIELYFQNYLETALIDVERAYKLLDEKYKESKFENISEYKKFIERNKEKYERMCKSSRKTYEDFDTYQEYEEYYREISKSGLSMYNIIESEDNDIYICIDNEGYYYIFTIKSIMNYTLMLDTYTIDIPSFIEKYDQATNQNKAGMNIEKFMTAINEQDYRYAYNCLATSFKQNNFPTLESFKEYASNTFFKNNTTEYKNVSEEGKYYVYELNITDSNDSTNYIEKQFIVNLKDNREFELSFELE